ncbi:MAG: hypothetical protein GF313_04280 [Caldithrix sp.]|nr:hypothetical protein [Caldithrix sp.]
MTTWKFWKKPVKQKFREAVYAPLQKLPPEEQKEIYNQFVYESGRVVFEMGFWFNDNKRSSHVDASNVLCPVLNIAGTDDRIVNPSVVRKIHKKYHPVSTYKEFENHGHWLISEPGWPDITNYINKWLNQNLKKDSGS